MENEFAKVMANNSDEELIEIVTKHREDYKPEAVMAAEEEIKKRNLSIDRIEKAKAEIEKKETKQLEKENQPLGMLQRILFFIFFWGIIPWMMAGTYKADGYTRKYLEAWKFIKYGFLTWLILTGGVVLIIYLNFI